MKRNLFLPELLFLLISLPSCNSIAPSSFSSSASEEVTSFEAGDSSNLGSELVSDFLVSVTGDQIPVASMKIDENLKGCHFQDISSQIDNDGIGSGDVYTKDLRFYLDGTVSDVTDQVTDSSFGMTVNTIKESVFEMDDQFYCVLESNDRTEIKAMEQQSYEKRSFELFSNAQYLYQGQLGAVYSLADYRDASFHGLYFQDEFCYGTHQSFTKGQDLYVYHFDGVNSSGSKMSYDLMFSFAEVNEKSYLSYYFASESFIADKWIVNQRSTETIYEYGDRENGTGYPEVPAEGEIN